MEEICRNCLNPLPEGVVYCPRCSQKNTDGRLTIRQLMQEFLSYVFNIYAKIFRTLGALAVPGKLTKEYFEGKQVRYYHPVRLFIVAAGFFTAMLTIAVSRSMEGNSTDFEAKKRLHEEKLFSTGSIHSARK